MDPLSVSAAIVGILGASTGAISTLRSIWRTISEAPKFAQYVLSEVTGISGCLGQLQLFLLNIDAVDRSRAALLMVDQVLVSLTECVSVFSELQIMLDRLKADGETYGPKDKMPLAGRLRVGMGEQDIKDIVVRLQASKSTLNLMLTTVTCSSVEEARSSAKELTGLVRELLDCNHQMSARLTDLERQASVRAPFESDDASTIRPREANHTPDVPELSINPLIQHSFEEDLHTSRVYTRVRTHTSDISTVSTSRKSTAWSYWSRISLSDVSNSSKLLSDNLDQEPDDTVRQILLLADDRQTCVATIAVILQHATNLLRAILKAHGLSLSPRDVEGRIPFSVIAYANPFDEFFCSNVREAFDYIWNSVLWYEKWFESDGPRECVGFTCLEAVTAYAVKHASDAVRKNHLRSSIRGPLHEFAYFIENASRVFSAFYSPTDEDVVRSWFHKEAARETRTNCSKIDGNEYHLEVLDAPVRRNYVLGRFDGKVDGIIFIADLTAYDCIDTNHVNKMKHSIAEFEYCAETCISTPIFLILNNVDMFAEQVRRSPISTHFPEFKGGQAPEEAIAYFLKRFQHFRQSNTTHDKYDISPHLCNAQDPRSIREILNAVQLQTRDRQSKASILKPHFGEKDNRLEEEGKGKKTGKNEFLSPKLDELLRSSKMRGSSTY